MIENPQKKLEIEPMLLLSDDERAALERLLSIAQSDTGQSRRVADFILAWWNAPEQGGFDVADVFGVDTRIAQDMAIIFSFLCRQNNAVYPDDYRADIEAIIRQWRRSSHSAGAVDGALSEDLK